MNKHIYIDVFLHGLGYTPCGVLTFSNDSNFSSFSYFNEYIQQRLPSINPATLNWKTNKNRHFIIDRNACYDLLDKTFWELLPNDNDWGDHVLSEYYPEYGNMNKIEKLYFLGTRDVGGLSSYKKEPSDEESIKGINWLDKVRENSIDFYLRNLEKITFVKALKPLTGYGGIRPKCMFEDENGELWIAKFNLPNDQFDMALFEKTTLDMAKDLGCEIAETKVLKLPSGENVLLSKRFDIEAKEKKHSLSIFALSDANKVKKGNYPGNPSTHISSIIKNYSDYKDDDTKKLIEKLIVDISLNNTDNHLRNIRMILNNEHKWELAPLYDVVANHYSQGFIYNPLECEQSDIYISNPNIVDIFSEKFGIDEQYVAEKVSNMIQISSNWEEYCDKNGMSYEDKILFCRAVNIGFNKKDNFKVRGKNIQIKSNLPKPKLK